MISHPMPTAHPAGRARAVVLVTLLLLTLAGLACLNSGPAAARSVTGSVSGTPHCPLHDDPVAVAPVTAPAAARPGSCGEAPGCASAIGALLFAPVLLTTSTRRGARLPDGRHLLLLLRVSRR